MNGLGWALVGAGSVSALGLLFFLATEREFRTALGQVLAVLVVGPALLIGALVRTHGVRASRLSPEALALFARQNGSDMQPAWLLGYRGAGVILVRRRQGRDATNDVPNRAERVREDVRRGFR